MFHGDKWNKMPEEVAEESTFIIFKRHLERYIDCQDGTNASKWDEFRKALWLARIC